MFLCKYVHQQLLICYNQVICCSFVKKQQWIFWKFTKNLEMFLSKTKCTEFVGQQNKIARPKYLLECNYLVRKHNFKTTCTSKANFQDHDKQKVLELHRSTSRLDYVQFRAAQIVNHAFHRHTCNIFPMSISFTSFSN